jgi:hypothetical protein
MAKKKGITQSQDTGGRPGFGSFLARLAADSFQFQSLPEAAPPTPEEDAQSTKRAWERVFLPKKVARLAAELAALKRANNPGRKCLMWAYVREAKRKYPPKASDHAFIARFVDSLLEKAGKELRDVCPKKWREIPDLPRLLRDGLQHPKLKKRIRVFISKILVS